MSDSVCAIVVTYNRKNLLIECLEALRKQTRPIQGIYLIDNASTDGTPELLLEKGYISELPPQNLKEPWEKEFIIQNLVDGREIKLYYVRMHENTGGAGGFYEGVKRGYEKGYDWLWLMDDDIEPKSQAIEIMLTYKNIAHVIHPCKVYIDGTLFTWEYLHFYMFPFTKELNDISFAKYGKKWVCVNYGCFEGMLIHRSIIEKIGFPDKKYFTMFDDTIYGFKASLHTNVIYINEILFIKKIKKTYKRKNLLGLIEYTEEKSDTTAYYSIRNYFLLYKDINKLIKDYIPPIIFWLFITKFFVKKVTKYLLLRDWNLLIAAIKGFKDGVKYILSSNEE